MSLERRVHPNDCRKTLPSTLGDSRPCRDRRFPERLVEPEHGPSTLTGTRLDLSSLKSVTRGLPARTLILSSKDMYLGIRCGGGVERTPAGPFWPVFRTYGPGKAILDHTWKLPTIERIG